MVQFEEDPSNQLERVSLLRFWQGLRIFFPRVCGKKFSVLFLLRLRPMSLLRVSDGTSEPIFLPAARAPTKISAQGEDVKVLANNKTKKRSALMQEDGPGVVWGNFAA